MSDCYPPHTTGRWTANERRPRRGNRSWDRGSRPAQVWDLVALRLALVELQQQPGARSLDVHGSPRRGSQPSWGGLSVTGVSPAGVSWGRSPARSGGADGITHEDREPAWPRPLPAEGLLGDSYRSRARKICLEGGHHIAVYPGGDEVAHGDGVARLKEALDGLGPVPELLAIQEIHIVEDLGHFVNRNEVPLYPIRALAPDAQGRLLIARRLLSRRDQIRDLLREHVQRQRQAMVEDVCQVRERTLMAQVRIVAHRAGEEASSALSVYMGRPLIGRDRRITGGVYLSASGRRPAIVVDPARDRRLQKVYEELVRRLPSRRLFPFRRQQGPESEEDLLSRVNALTQQYLPSWAALEHGGQRVDDAVMASMTARGRSVRPNQKIYLGEYLRIANAGGGGGGECVHQSLLAGHLLERLLDEGRLAGRVSFERNHIASLGTHAWIRFAASDERVYILDPSLDHVGPLGMPCNWLYMRSEDLQALRALPF